MNRLIPCLGLLVLACSLGCSAQEAPPVAYGSAMVTAPAQAPAGQPGAEAAEPVLPRKLIRTADLTLTADDTVAAAQAIQDLALTLKGYVSAVNARRQEELLFFRITLRVPGDQFIQAVAELEKLADVDEKNIDKMDVTDRFVDLDARLRTLQLTEIELQALLAESREQQRQMADILAIYRELTGIRSKIEQLQGQLKSLEDKIAYSTLNIVLNPTEAARPLTSDDWSPTEEVRSSARLLVEVLQGLVNIGIKLVFLVLPVLVVLAIPLWALIRVWLYACKRWPRFFRMK